MAEYLDNMSISEQDQGSQSNTTSQRNSTRPTQIVSVRKRSLNHLGYKDLKHWLTNPQNIYIGWDMTHYVPGAVGSKWEITYKERDYPNIETRLEMYRKYIETDRTKYDGKTLFESLEELRGKTLGCWCKPDPCHGDIIIQLLKSKPIPETLSKPSECCSDLPNDRMTEGTVDRMSSCKNDINTAESRDTKPSERRSDDTYEGTGKGLQSDMKSGGTRDKDSITSQRSDIKSGTGDDIPSHKSDIKSRTGDDIPSHKSDIKSRTGNGISVPSHRSDIKSRTGDDIPSHRSDIKSRTGDGIQVPSHRSDIKSSRTGDGIQVPSHRSDIKSRTGDGTPVPSHRSDIKSMTGDGIPVPSHRSDIKSGTGDDIPSHRSDIKSRTGDGIPLPSQRSDIKSRAGDGTPVPSHRSDIKSRTGDGIPVPSHRSDIKSRTGDGIPVPSHRSDIKSRAGDGIPVPSHRSDIKSRTGDDIPSDRSDMKFERMSDSKSSQRTRKIQSARPPVTRIVSVKKRSLNHQGYNDLEHWLTNPNNVYIGRDMTHYVPGAVGSKWQNPFKVDQHGRGKCIEMYKEYIQTDIEKYNGKTLLESLEELRGKTLGCWCSPDPCHGDVIVQLLKSKT